MVNDVEAESFLKASSWEHMSTLCEEHARACKELVNAELEDFLYESNESLVRLTCAIVACSRAERKLSLLTRGSSDTT